MHVRLWHLRQSTKVLAITGCEFFLFALSISPCPDGAPATSSSFNVTWPSDHRLNLVVLSGQRYLVDVGMGTRGPIVVLPLTHGFTTTSVPPGHVRLLHGCIPESSSLDSSNKLWRLESRKDEDSPWVPTYAFSESEFFQADYEVVNWYCFTNPRSWFLHDLVASRLILDDVGEQAVGSITFARSTFRRTRYGKLECAYQSSNEKERAEVLRTQFDIQLTSEEEDSLRRSLPAVLRAKM